MNNKNAKEDRTRMKAPCNNAPRKNNRGGDKEKAPGDKEQDERKRMETSKKIALFLFVLLNVIIVYAMVAMWYFADLNCLSVLITDIAAQILVYAIYCLKAFHGKKQEEEVKLEKEKYAGRMEFLTNQAKCENSDDSNG